MTRSHEDEQRVMNIVAELESLYGEIDVTWDPKQTHLGMDFDFSNAGEAKVSVQNYIQEIFYEFSDNVEGK